MDQSSCGKTRGAEVGVDDDISVDRKQIAATERLIRPHIRQTPVVEVDGGDFGLGSLRLSLKLELLQHAGSFNARGAFANLLIRDIPTVGGTAASGCTHRAADVYCMVALGIP